MNLVEELGGRICGSDYMFTHVAGFDSRRSATVGMHSPARRWPIRWLDQRRTRAQRIVRECQANGTEAVVVSRIPGASHCAREGEIILEIVRQRTGIPAIELEIPPVCDAMGPSLGSRLQAVVEVARGQENTMIYAGIDAGIAFHQSSAV